MCEKPTSNDIPHGVVVEEQHCLLEVADRRTNQGVDKECESDMHHELLVMSRTVFPIYFAAGVNVQSVVAE